jgi:hypothetical protein
MGNKYLIAVGGGGQEMALACLRLCHMAGDQVDLPMIYVFDSDTGRVDDKVKTRFWELSNLAELTIEYRKPHPSILNLQEVYSQDQRVSTVGSLFRPHNAPQKGVDTVLDLCLPSDSRARPSRTDFTANRRSERWDSATIVPGGVSIASLTASAADQVVAKV